MKNIILGVLEFGFIMMILAGFIFIISEADPWSRSAQIKLYIEGVILIVLGALGTCIIEKREGCV